MLDVGQWATPTSCALNVATSSFERCTQCAHLAEVLDRRAAVELAAVLLFLDRLSEVRVQPKPEPARQLRRLGHQLARDRERRARRDRDLDLCAVRETGCGLCRSKCFVACLHDRVGRKPALRLAEVHRAP
jgi:hypothetical protein